MAQLTRRTLLGFHHITEHWREQDRAMLERLQPDWGKIVLLGSDEKVPHLDTIGKCTRHIVIRHYKLSEMLMGEHPSTPNYGNRYFKDATDAQDVAHKHAAFILKIAVGIAAQGFDLRNFWFEGINEPQLWAGETPDLVDVYYSTLASDLHALGMARFGFPLNLMAFNFGIGWPGNYGVKDHVPDWRPFWRTHAAMLPTDRVGVHLYFGIGGTSDPTWLWHSGSFLFCPWTDVRIVATEGGCDNGVNGNHYAGWQDIPSRTFDDKVQAYVNMLADLDQQAMRDSRMDGILIFTHDYQDNMWQKFNTQNDVLLAKYVPYLAGQVTINMLGDFRTARWERLLAPIAADLGVPLKVAATVLALESGGDPAIVSSAGAVGLMQVMPGEIIAGRPEAALLLNPQINMREGCEILADNLLWYKQDLALALAAYYVGVGTVDKTGTKSAAAQQYLSRFKAVWTELFPGDACPINTSFNPPPIPNPTPADIYAALVEQGDAHQVIQFNPTAALQKHIFADGFVPNSPEFEGTGALAGYIVQRSEQLGGTEVRYYYVPIERWDEVKYALR
jgi:hypothetical protein